MSAVVEDEDAAVVEGNFDGLPGRSLVVALGLGAGGVSFLVEPIEVRIVIRNPFLDGLPRGLDRLHGLDVEVAREQPLPKQPFDTKRLGKTASTSIKSGNEPTVKKLFLHLKVSNPQIFSIFSDSPLA